MKTLNKNITTTFYNDETGFDQLRQRWGCLVQDKERCKTLTCMHHLLYLILMGKNWQKALRPITNHRKLENGADSSWIERRALMHIIYTENMQNHLELFADILSDDAITRIRQQLPRYTWSSDILSGDPYADSAE